MKRDIIIYPVLLLFLILFSSCETLKTLNQNAQDYAKRQRIEAFKTSANFGPKVELRGQVLFLEAREPVTIAVYDTLGQLVYGAKDLIGSVRVDFNYLASGSYIIYVYYDTGFSRFRMIALNN